MIPDADCLCVLTEILNSLPIGGYVVKINHRKLLDAIMTVSGVNYHSNQISFHENYIFDIQH
jgi:histidyl-tRNA synthetase